jgi:hypothetical protein
MSGQQIAGLVQTLEASVAMLETGDTDGGQAMKDRRAVRSPAPQTKFLTETQLVVLAICIAKRMPYREISAKMGFNEKLLRRHAKEHGLLPDGVKTRRKSAYRRWSDPEFIAKHKAACAGNGGTVGIIWSDDMDRSLCIMIAASFSWRAIERRLGVCYESCQRRARAIGFLTGRENAECVRS